MSRNDNSRKGKTSGRGATNAKFKGGSKVNAPQKRVGKSKPAAPAEPIKKAPSKRTNTMEGIRLNKYISNSGICSRREADTYIATGLVSVNGKIINEMGYKVKLEDDVRFDGRRLSPEPMAYVLLNKPKGFATTTSDSKGNTVMDLVSNATSAKITPIGRLGRNSTGLLFFTNDDKLKEKLSKKGMERLFHIELDKNLKAADLQKIKDGLTIDGKKVEVIDVSYVKDKPKKEVGLKIKNMGNSIIRDIFDYLNYDVVKLDCVTLAHLTKKDLPRGRWKILTKQELELFGML
ncbi:pseudouridylate synthase [Patiriisocius marinistellae]|uniref:Pseudouridylate synthase n=1 Tax=Patiriisocius marinistellae TaxID=2494560 RepID=A0A5J4FZZ0_9FLAO|nr:pseudouridine synthase [Patiriisocius marinistellae]GEQ85311.1 pseudouridylate synthase [Patiriisocius marinistellae]